ncbi:carboxypeptidase regulatory-like domain-containing protein [candidate division WWE3 bacterium]|nr:carboxypeptidase regulatory-like domain-containing protein [candidate division WWE3 bacterium]
MRFIKHSIFIFVILAVFLVVPAHVHATTPYPTRIPCDSLANPLLVPSCAVRQLPVLAIYMFNMSVITAVIASLAFMIYAGYLYVTAQDDTRQQEQARATITYSIFGLILAGSAYILLRTFTQPFNIDIFSYFKPTSVYAQEQSTQEVPTPTVATTATVDPNSLVQLSGKVRTLSEHTILAGVEVTLYWLNNGRWEVWPAQTFDNQRNPYTSDVFGQYQFFVPAGQYYVEINKVGYYKQVTDVVEIKNASVAVDVYLKQATTIWIYLLIVGVVAFFSALAYIVIQKINQWRKHQEMRSLVRRQIRGNDEQNGTDRP